MTASVDRWLSARHLGDEYNCLHFARDVWLAETGEDLEERLSGLLGSAAEGRRAARHRPDRSAMRRLDAPEDPCLVLMRRPRSQPHAGVYLRGRVLHLTERGAEFHEPGVAARGFSKLEYYR